jgi:carbamoyl-phosphate synthase large subunit
LASKATGFPIAKIAAKLAVGYSLDEIPNDLTGRPSNVNPAIDYVVVKVPRFAFEKFSTAEDTLTTHMKSVGEAMAIGRNFTEALGKAMRSLEDSRAPLPLAGEIIDKATALALAARPHDSRLQAVVQALRAGATVEEVNQATMIDPWFLDQIQLILGVAARVKAAYGLDPKLLRLAKRHGLSDAQIGELRGISTAQVRSLRWAMGVRPVFKTVDTCAGQYPALTPYHYSTYDEETEVQPRTKPAVIILGSGPNRIGQGIEFDYSCVHAAMALSEAGFETVMVNCNPETVSTDPDTSDRLYFEPLTEEDVLEIYAAEAQAGPVAGVIVQLGGQTPLKLAAALKAAGVPMVGTQPEAIDLAEERGAFGRVLAAANLPAPRFGMATSGAEAIAIAAQIGYPVLVRPSYVLGGRGMEIVYDDATLMTYVTTVTKASVENPIMIDKFLDDATEIDVDAIFDGDELYIGGILEHIEEAGVHSGDSACVLPPITLGVEVIEQIRASTRAIAAGVGVRGLINIQFALVRNVLYVLEANPRASRTVPFVSKSTNVQLAKAAALVMLGATISELRERGILCADRDGSTIARSAPVAVKEAVMPFNRFHTSNGQAVDTLLGPEMRSTGEVMGLDANFGIAYAKSQTASYGSLPKSGAVFVSVANSDKRHAILPVQMLFDMGFEILATTGTADVLARNGIPARAVRKRSEGIGPAGEKTIVDLVLSHEVDLIINTPYSSSGSERRDGYGLRSAAVMADIPCVTTIQGLIAVVQGIAATRKGEIQVRSLQQWGPAMRPIP